MNPFRAIKNFAAGFMLRSVAGYAAQFATGADLDVKARGLANAYQRSAWVRAAIAKAVGPMSAVELCLTENDEEIEDPTLEAFWDAPGLNPDGTRMSQADFVEALGAWMLLAGEYFLLLDETWNLRFPEVAVRTPLIIARPDRMRHIVRGGELIAWEFTDAGSRRVMFDAARVVHVKMFNPYDPWRGLGPLEAAAIAAGADYASAVFAKNVAEANGDQGMVVVAKGAAPTPEQQEQIKTALREKAALQRMGIFRPVFLGGDITIEDPKMRAVDAAFVSQRLENRREIAIAFGVPPSFFDPQASYSVGSASDRFILIEETCKPLGRKLTGGLARVATLQVGRPIECDLDWDEHSTMQAVRRERIDAGLKLWGTGMPMDKVSDYLSLDIPEYPGWNQGYLPFSVTPTGTAFEPTTDPALAEEEPAPAEEIVQDMRRLFARRNTPAPVTGHVCGCDVHQLASDRPASEIALWKSHMVARQASVKLYRSRFDRALLKVRAEVIRKLEAVGQASITRAGTAVDLLFDQQLFKADLYALMRGAHENALESAGKQVFAEVGKTDPFKTPPLTVINFVRERENRLKNVPDEVFERIRTQIEEGFNAGDTMKQIADRVRSEFNEISDERGKVIAQTETAAAYGTGRNEAMKQAGVQFKKWLTSGNANVRAGHRIANGQIVPIEEPFMVESASAGVEELMHPGDPNGSADNVINCHCVSIAVAKPDGEVEPSD